MIKFFKKLLFKKSTRIGIIFGVVILTIIAFFDPALAIGLLWLAIFAIITIFLLSKNKKKSKITHLLFLIALLIHLAAVLFIYWTDFKPFGGGTDYDLYHYNGQEIAKRIGHGHFSLEGLRMGHYYSVIIGFIYFFTLPEMIIPQMLTALLAALSCLLVYWIVLEIGGSKKWAFLTGLLVALYPSYLYFGSTMLKDTLVIPLILIGLLFCLKLIKKFSWKNFLVFYFALTAAIHFRFYVGFALLFTFIISWLIWGRLSRSSSSIAWEQAKEKLIYTIIIFVLLGFSPQVSGFGYYGIKPLNSYINPSSITRFREVYYLPPSKPVPVAVVPTTPTSLSKKIFSKLLPQIEERPVQETGMGSSMVIETGLENPFSFIKNSLKSFTYVILGPLPWQIKYYNQLVAFLETIPWYFLLFFIIKGAWKAITRYRLALPLLIFSILSLTVLSVFITNFGIASRIRIPSFIALLCLIPFGFARQDKKYDKNETSPC